MEELKLYAWQPKGHGELSWFVLAKSEMAAKSYVESEMVRRKSLPDGDDCKISNYECRGWGTEYYALTVASIGVVLTNENE